MGKINESHGNYAFPFLLNQNSLIRFLTKHLTSLLQDDLALTNIPLKIGFSLPDEKVALHHLKTNQTLLAQLAVTGGGIKKSISFVFPYPINGIFIFRSEDSEDGKAGKWIWHPHLVGRPGIWNLRHHELKQGGKETPVRQRLVYSDGTYVKFAEPKAVHTKASGMLTEKNEEIGYSEGQANWNPSLKKQTRKRLRKLLTLFCYERELESNNQQLQNTLIKYLSDLHAKTKEPRASYEDIYNYFNEYPLEELIVDRYAVTDNELYDFQDIGWQRLYTYSAFLAERVIELFCEKWLDFVFKPEENRKEGDPDNLWDALYTLNHTRLVSPRLRKDLLEEGRFHFINPINGIETLSRITSFQRYNYRTDELERLPAIYRQNHPSFRGVVCPVESPESKKVGLTLHLSRKARVDVLGRLTTTGEKNSGYDLGFGASLVPFYEHNDGPRAMMGAKNMKQAVPIKGEEQKEKNGPYVKTGCEDEAASIVKPLAESELIPACAALSPGVDILVAYMPWYGWNMEDAIVANSRLVSEGVLDWESEEEFSQYIRPGFELVAPEFENTFEEAFKQLRYGKDHLHKTGGIISPSIPVAFFKNSVTGKKQPVLCGGEDPGELLAIEYKKPATSYLGGKLTWKVHHTYPLMVGDKLMGRYGNKGVVSAILDDKDMPCLPSDPRLPLELYGRPVDLILNPHGVISRMNLGQLLETQIGLLHRLIENCPLPADIGKAFTSKNTDQLRELFLKAGGEEQEPLFDEHGRIHLEMPDGKKTGAPVTVGFQHIVRLKHVAVRKFQARGSRQANREYPYKLITGQPVGGRRRKGGQRLGEMEIWALSANMAPHAIRNALSRKSDPGFANATLPFGQTFQAIKDHLYALGYTMQEDDKGHVRLQCTTANNIDPDSRQIRSKEMWTLAELNGFFCSNEKCNYSFPDTVIATGKKQRGSSLPRLTLGDVIRAQGFILSEGDTSVLPALSPEAVNGTIQITLKRLTDSEPQNRFLFYTRKGRTLHLRLALDKRKINAYRQLDAKGIVPVAKLMETTFISCPKHTSQELKCVKHQSELLPKKGGLCDQEIFGNIDISNYQSGAGGYIRLPAEPFRTQEKEQFTKHPLLLSLYVQAGMSREEEVLLPLLPLKYRYQSPALRGMSLSRQEDKISSIYQGLISLANKSPSLTKNQQKQVFDSIILLSELLSDRLFHKSGLIRRKGLGRRVDMSGRLVIVPDPALAWDSCGVPTEIMIVLLGPTIAEHPEVIREYLTNHADAEHLINVIFGFDSSLTPSTPEIELELLAPSFWEKGILPDKKRSAQYLELAYGIIEHYLAKHPETTVLLNRQPSLHRYSMMGFHPVPLHIREGMVLKINPLVCKGFGADFDGDEMTIHMPVSAEEQAEYDRMKPTRRWNLVSAADGFPMPNFDQDFVAGHFYISLDEKRRQELISLFPQSCPRCSDILGQTFPWKKEHGIELLAHLCEEHSEKIPSIVPQWMQQAFAAVTEGTLSFGFLELEHIQKKLSVKVHETDKNLADEAIEAHSDSYFSMTVQSDLYITFNWGLHFLLNEKDEEIRKKFADCFPVASCETCKMLLQQHPMVTEIQKFRHILLNHICAAHADTLSEIANPMVTIALAKAIDSGLVVGSLVLRADEQVPESSAEDSLQSIYIYDAARLICNDIALLARQMEQMKVLQKDTKDLGKTVIEELHHYIFEKKSDHEWSMIRQPKSQGFGFAALALSGARKKEPTRQILLQRGLLSPGAIGFSSSPKDFFISQSMTQGMTPDAAFFAAMNARSSMVDKKLNTGLAGHLTRQLVLILWDWVVMKGDCGQTKAGRPLNRCNWSPEKRICEECYGKIPGRADLPDNYPAGLIAAQSFGERGTQLSMQSFHTAEKQLSLDDVIGLLEGRDPAKGPSWNWFDDPIKANGFVERIKAQKGYDTIDQRHIRLIWLAIHLSRQGSITGAWQVYRTPLSGLAGSSQKQALYAAAGALAIADVIAEAADEDQKVIIVEEEQIVPKPPTAIDTVEDFTSPLARVMTGRPPVQSIEQE